MSKWSAARRMRALLQITEFIQPLGYTMQPKFMYRDENAWEQGDLAYDLGDTLETGTVKAARLGIRPGGESYAAFMTAFSRRVRSRQVSPGKVQMENAAILQTQDFIRAG